MPKERGSDDKGSNSLGGRDKSRGIRHQRDKTKYKSKSVKDSKHVPPKTKSCLGSNWDRYETEDDANTSQLSSSTDFSILANAPITQGQHFQFKHDRFMTEEINKKSQELFSLDLNMLKHSILTVPFFERIGIEKKYFSENQINFMNKNAESCEIRYNDKYNTKKEGISQNIEEVNVDVNRDSNHQTESFNIPDEPSNKKEGSEETSELINKMVDLMRSEKNDKLENSSEDLEQWLDDILDD